MSGLSHAAQRYALLVGVSEYPGLVGRNLPGPRNDVRLMHTTLRARGFDASAITVVADGVPASFAPIEPTRERILAALDRIVAQLQPGDFLYVHFSGHGSQQPERVPGQEPDGYDETFLARDATRWDGSRGSVDGAITDDEIGERLRAATARGASVWAVFDTCNAGTMTRGSEPGDRQIPPSALGVPPPESRPRPVMSKSALDVSVPRSQVAFFATSPQGVTADFRPRLLGDAHGVFTYVIAEGLSAWPGATYRQLAQFVHQRYGSLGIVRAGPPLFEGDLDAPVLGDRTIPPVRQWPVLLDKDGLPLLEAGALSMFGEGALFALVQDPRAPTREAFGLARAAHVTAASTRLAPAPNPAAPTATARVSDLRRWAGTYARLLDANPPLSVRVALRVERGPAGQPIELGDRVRAGLDRVRSDRAYGPPVQWVTAEELADLEVRVTRAGARVCGDAGALGTRDSDCRSVMTRAPADSAAGDDIERFASELGTQLRQAARVMNLLRLAPQLAAPLVGGSTSALNVDVRAWLVRADGQPRKLLDSAELPTLRPGDSIALEASNRDRDPVDFTVIAIDPAWQARVVYPASGDDSPRLAAGGTSGRPLGRPTRVDSDAAGAERLVVLAVRGSPSLAPADLSGLLADRAPSAAMPTGSPPNGPTPELLQRALMNRGVGDAPAQLWSPSTRPDVVRMWVYGWRSDARRR